MAENKKSFIMYCDWAETFNCLPDDKAGELIKHIFKYVNDEDPQTEDVLINAVFANIKNQLKRDLKKYEEFIERQTRNGQKGGRPKQTQKTHGLSGKPKKPDTDTVTDNDTVTDINNSNSNELPQPDAFDSYIKTWTQATGRTIKSKRSEVAKTAIKHFNARIREGYTLEEITTAINNAASDPHHSESGYKWLTLDFILRPQQLERWREDNREQRKEADMISQVAAIAERIERERQAQP